MATYKANRAAELVVESQSQNGDDDDNGNGGVNGNGNRDKNGRGNGNRNRGGNGNGNPNRNDRGVMPVTREWTYHGFVKCQPLNFKGTNRFVGLISALTWWNAYKRTVGADSAFSMSWRELMKLMIEVYYPRNGIQKMMDQKLKGYAAKSVENKRRLNFNKKDNHAQQSPYKRQNVGGQNVARSYTAGNNERRRHAGP
ncbi:hypothetical protein Tco_0063037 [Tanacetum coccineum]